MLILFIIEQTHMLPPYPLLPNQCPDSTETALKQLRQVLSNTETVLGWGCTGDTAWGSVNWDKYFEQ